MYYNKTVYFLITASTAKYFTQRPTFSTIIKSTVCCCLTPYSPHHSNNWLIFLSMNEENKTLIIINFLLQINFLFYDLCQCYFRARLHYAFPWGIKRRQCFCFASLTHWNCMHLLSLIKSFQSDEWSKFKVLEKSSTVCTLYWIL